MEERKRPGDGGPTGKVELGCPRERGELFPGGWLEVSPGLGAETEAAEETGAR